MAKQELQNIADAIEYTTNPAETHSDFSGHSIADSMGWIADAMLRIAEALEKQNKEEA